MNKIIKIILYFFVFIIIVLGLMFVFKICPPAGPWVSPPWCSNLNKNNISKTISKNNTKKNKTNIKNLSKNISSTNVVKNNNLDKTENKTENKQILSENINPEKIIIKKGFQKGVTFGAMKWSDSEKKYLNSAFKALQEFNVSWIEIIPEWFVTPDEKGVDIKPFYQNSTFPNKTGWISPSLKDDELINIINKAKSLGIKVVLKPQIDPINFGLKAGASRGSLNPSDWNVWFDNYKKFILHYAKIASSEKVSMFIIGTELDTAVREAPQAKQKWENIISEVRKIYSGPITYSVSCFGQCWSPDQVSFWQDLDYIGFEPYFGLTNKNNPTVAEMEDEFNKKLLKYAKPLADRYGKKIIITEANVYSYDGVNKNPINPPPTGAKEDYQEQANYYQAVFKAISDKNWIDGIYWWAWYLDSTPQTASYLNDLYDPFIRKPAGQVLKNWYRTIKTN